MVLLNAITAKIGNRQNRIARNAKFGRFLIFTHRHGVIDA